MKLDRIAGPRGVALLLLAATATGCEEKFPTIDFDRDFPIEAVTVEVRLSYDDFATDFAVVGTYGLPSALPVLTVAHEFGDSLEAHALYRFDEFPGTITAPDSTGTNRQDTLFTMPSGRLLVRFDTMGARPDGPFELVAEALPQEWDRRTANWNMAVDTVLRQVPWDEPGGGPGTLLGRGEWADSVAGSDSLFIELDSAAVALLADSLGMRRGLRVRMADSQKRVRLQSISLEADARPSFNADTLLNLDANLVEYSFVYTPAITPQEGDMTVGGVPAWRTVMRIELPEFLDGDEATCARVTCPIKLTADRVVYAAIRFTGRSQALPYSPIDTLLLDVRTVVAPEILPRSPVTSAVIPFATTVPPHVFNDADPGQVEIPVTFYIRDLIAGETSSGDPVYPTMALLVPLEPLSFDVMRFFGPGSEYEPVLRILLTLSDEVDLS